MTVTPHAGRQRVEPGLNRYPPDGEWVDDDANFALRRSEAQWLDGLRGKTVPAEDEMAALVRWKFRWAAARKLPLQAVSGSRYRETAEQVERAISDARSHPDDDMGAMERISRIRGFGVPMASVCLALYFPGRFTLADSRALRTLRARRGFRGGPPRFLRGDWLPYLHECRKLLDECRASEVVPPFEGEWTLRCVDQALWAANGAAEVSR